MYCKVGKCPEDQKSPLCCIYCTRREGCPNRCLKKNLICNLSFEVKEKNEVAATTPRTI